MASVLQRLVQTRTSDDIGARGSDVVGTEAHIDPVPIWDISILYLGTSYKGISVPCYHPNLRTCPPPSWRRSRVVTLRSYLISDYPIEV